MKVINEVQIYEVDGTETPPAFDKTLTVESHRTYDDRIVLGSHSNKPITVLVRELQKAIENAANHK